MEKITYIGEHLWLGNIGNAFVILSLVAALASTISYYFYSKEVLTTEWKKIAGWFFSLHSIAVIGIAGTIFYGLFNHFYEIGRAHV